MLREKTSAWRFPFLFGGTFIEAEMDSHTVTEFTDISLPFRRDFH